jgi:hypothetical protein
MKDTMSIIDLVQRTGYYVPAGFFLIVVSSCITYWILNKSRVSGWFQAAQDVVPPFVAFPGVLFGLFAAMLASDIWQHHHEANMALISETSAISSMASTSAHLDSADRLRLITSINNYTTAVLKKEWPAMATGDHSGKGSASTELRQLNFVSIDIASQKSLPKLIETRIQQPLDTIRTARLQRLSLAHDSISTAKWRATMLFGILVLITVGVVHLRRPRAMVIALAISATCIFCTILMLANNRSPYSGVSAIKPQMLEDVIQMHDATVKKP